MSGSRTYSIRTGGRPSGNPANYNYSLIQSLLEATSQEKVSAAGAAYNSAARIVGMVAHELYVVGTRLSEKWEGADADAAQKALGQLYATANELFGRSQQAGAALQTYGAALKQFKGLQWPNWPTDGASPVEDDARQKVAEKVMQAVNNQIAAAWDSMPDKVQQNLPTLKSRQATAPYSSGAGSGGVSGGAGGHGGGGGVGGASRGVHLPHSPDSPQGGGHGFPTMPGAGHGADLAGGPPTGGGLGTVPPPAGNPFPSGLSGGTPSMPGGGLTSGGIGGPPLYPGPGSLPRSGSGSSRVPSENLELSSEEAAASRAAAAAEAEASQAARSGFMGPPGAPGGAAGTKDTERERTTWLAEEEATWGAEEDIVGRALGAPPAAGSAGEAETELERKAWLSEDQDVWTGGETLRSGTIGEAPPQRDEGNADDVLDELEEPDILDPERLQELLDVIMGPEEETAGTPESAAGTAPGLLEDLSGEEVNDIDRLLNG